MTLTCPECRARGDLVEVEIADQKSDTRSVEEKIRFRCPQCGWLSDAYSF